MKKLIEMALRVACSCGSVSNIKITESDYTDRNEIDLSTSIEQNSEGLFYCLQNDPESMKINCVMCGSDIYLQY